MSRTTRVFAVLALAIADLSAIGGTIQPTLDVAVKTIPYAEAAPILDSLKSELIPDPLRNKTPPEREQFWPEWVNRRDAEIRARLDRGDEDSLVNFLAYGTTFTKQPRLRERDLLTGQVRNSSTLRRRIADLVAGIAAPGENERLQFARQIVARRRIDPTTESGKQELRDYLADAFENVLVEYQELFGDRTESEHQTRFQARGLSSDTSIFFNFAIEQALQALKTRNVFGPGDIRRVAIVGPGLDFTDKREGYDFYPQQTIQPFAVVDSVLRLGLGRPGALEVTTFDLSPRVNQHLESARERAKAGAPYTLQLPRDSNPGWAPTVVEYWRHFGERIGVPVKPAAVPPGVGKVFVRAIRVRPDVVRSIVPHDLNIVLQRIEPTTPDERFDLIIATNILIYYDVFEQTLALSNIGKMLRPDGVLLSNTIVPTLPATPIVATGHTDVTYDAQAVGIDRITWYSRE